MKLHMDVSCWLLADVQYPHYAVMSANYGPPVTHILTMGGKKDLIWKTVFQIKSQLMLKKKITKNKYLWRKVWSPTGRPCQTQMSSRGRRGTG